MGKVDKELAIQMRREGRTYGEIAECFGVSHQAVTKMLKNCVRARKDCDTIDMIPYKGLYEFMVSHRMLTIEGLTAVMFSESDHAKHEKVRRFLRGHDISFPKHTYDNLIAYTGMTYEQLFEPREVSDG